MEEKINNEVENNETSTQELDTKEYEIQYEDLECPFRLKSSKARRKLKKIISEYATAFFMNVDLTLVNQQFINRMVKLGLKYPDLYHPFVRNDIIDYVTEHHPHVTKTVTAFCDQVQVIYLQSFKVDLDNDEAIQKLKEKSEKQLEDDSEFENLENDSVVQIEKPKIEKVESKLVY